MVASEYSVESGKAFLAGVEAGSGLPVVFLHAGVADHRMWTSQIEVVAEAGFQAIAYDRRGFGETESPDEPFSHLHDLEAVLDAFDIHAAVFVGCSMGGGLAIDFALRHPGRVIGLVLVGTAISGAPGDLTEAERSVAAAEEDAEERGDGDMLVRVRAHSWLDGPRTSGGRVKGAVRELFMAMNKQQLAHVGLTQEQHRPAAWPRVGAIGAPTLLVAGDEDYLYQIDWHEHLSETMPNAFAVVIENTAHLPSLERADLFNPLLLEFLDAVTGGGE